MGSYLEKYRTPHWSIWLGYQALTLVGRVRSPGAEFFIKQLIYPKLYCIEYEKGMNLFSEPGI